VQVLLLKDVAGLGHAGDIKEVAGGYAQNLLLPRKLAVPVTEGSKKQAESIHQAAERKRARKQTEAKALAARLEGQVLVFKARAGEGDRLYGSITSADIAERLSQALGIEIERRLVDLEHPIKSVGDHEVTVKVSSGVAARVRVVVERAKEEA
jgi:large subunit ribosomal protein L9